MDTPPEDLEETLRATLGLSAGWQVSLADEEAVGRRTGRWALSLSRSGHSFPAFLLTRRVNQPPPGTVWRGELGLHLPQSVPQALRDRLSARFQRGQSAPAALLHSSPSHGAEPGAPKTFDEASQHFRSTGQDLYHHAESNQQAVHGVMRLGFRCNQDCAFCWQGRQWPEAEQPWQERMQDLAERGVSSLIITGGEPTLYQELPEVVADSASRGWRTVLQTNGIGLANDRLRQRLMDAGLNGAFISFHSADADTSDRITRSPGTWVRTVAGIEAALEAGLRLRLNCVVDQRNVDSLADHARFIRDRFAHRSDTLGVDYSDMSPTYQPANYARLAVPLSRSRGPLVEASALLLDAGVDVSCSSGCGFPPCALVEEPRLLDQAFQAFLPYEHEGRDNSLATCAPCAWRERCRGPRTNYVALFGEDGLRPIDA